MLLSIFLMKLWESSQMATYMCYRTYLVTNHFSQIQILAKLNIAL